MSTPTKVVPTEEQIAEARAILAAAAETEQDAFDNLTDSQQTELADAIDSIASDWNSRVEDLECELYDEGKSELEHIIGTFGAQALKIYLDNNGVEFDGALGVNVEKIFDELNR